jgi:hypothetical protein
MSANLPPKTINGSLNSVFNTNDFASSTEAKNDAKYDGKYLKLTGGTLSGGLTTPSLSVNNSISTNGITSTTGTNQFNSLSVNNSITTNGITSTGTNQFNSNITLPTTYNASPNTSLPGTNQLGEYLSVSNSGTNASTGTVLAIVSLTLPPGIWMCVWRASIFPTGTGTGTYSNMRIAFTTTNATITSATDVQQRLSIAASQSCLGGATNGYDVSLMGSTIAPLTSSTTYYLNAVSVYTSSTTSQWRGHIHAVRIA